MWSLHLPKSTLWKTNLLVLHSLLKISYVAYSNLKGTRESQPFFVKRFTNFSFGCSHILLCMHIMQKSTENFTDTYFKTGHILQCHVISSLIWLSLWTLDLSARLFLWSVQRQLRLLHTFWATHTRCQPDFTPSSKTLNLSYWQHSTLLKVTIKHGFTSNVISVCNSLCHTVLILQIWAVNCSN